MSKRKLLVGMIASGMLMIALTGCSGEKNESQGTVASNVQLFGNLYTGSYEGELKNGSPEGKGIFKVEGDTIAQIEGNWKQGMLDGECIISYTDGTTEQGKMEENKFAGDVTKTLTDGTYSVSNYSKGRAVGAVKYYNAQDKLVDYDWLYQQIPVAQLIDQVQKIDYAQLVYFPKTYIGKMIQAKGVVESVYETEYNKYVTLKDSNEKIYVCKCKNIRVTNGKQAITQQFKVGDEIQVYGYFLKTGMYKHFNDDDTIRYNQYTGSLPYMEVVYGYEVNGGEFDPLSPSYEYEDVYKNPYGYAGMSANVTGTVNYVEINNKKKSAKIKLKVAENQYYYVNLKFNKKTEVLPSVNDNVTIKGKYFGLYKEEYLDDEDKQVENISDLLKEKYKYRVYPYLNAKSVTVNNK